MSKTVADLTGKQRRKKLPSFSVPWPLPDNDMGIELEVDFPPQESRNLPGNNLRYWEVHSDGSLQNGREFVLRVPTAGNELSTAIAEIMEYGPYPKNLTGSTHVHMDMIGSEENPTTHETLRILILMVYALENVLYAAGDRGRAFCGFCNPLDSGTDNLIKDAMDPDVSPDQFMRMYNRNSSPNSRYYGLNLLSLGQFGSLEFRYFPTASSADELVKYVKLVQLFKKAALSLRDVDELIDVFSDPDKFHKFIEREFAEFVDLFRANISFTQASMAVEKARSICALSNRKRSSVIDISKIVKSGKWKSIIGDVTINLGTLHRIEPAARIPPGTRGDVMVYCNNAYISRGPEMWIALIDAHPSDLTPRVRRLLNEVLADIMTEKYSLNPMCESKLRLVLSEEYVDVNEIQPDPDDFCEPDDWEPDYEGDDE